jgi:phosphopantothenoylcysteine decarboxylase
MKKPNILVAFTGSVASVLAPKVVEALGKEGNVAVILTERSKTFFDMGTLEASVGLQPSPISGCWGIYEDSDEWSYDGWKRGDDVLHITLRNWADVLVVAPLSANTLAKFANGICDNLLTSVFRAWDMTKPVVMAPAMNTMMWEHPVTEAQLRTIERWVDGTKIVYPKSKKLACGDVGVGAMADIDDIVIAVRQATQPQFPLFGEKCPGVPLAGHPGAFGYQRTWYMHPGIDLYTTENAIVRAMEPGIVVAIEKFTGKHAQSDWWLDTWIVAVEGQSGVIGYGEINPWIGNKVGGKVKRGGCIGYVTPVLPPHKHRSDVPGHSCSMLHLELYVKGQKEICPFWEIGKPKPDYLQDPTDLILSSRGCPHDMLTYQPAPKEEKNDQQAAVG